jgi:hypothetical protein
VAVSAVTGCVWTTASDVSWVDVEPAQATGNGSADVEVDPNTGASRSATVRVAGLPFLVEQAAAAIRPTPPPSPAPPPSPTPNPTPAPTPTPTPTPAPPTPAPAPTPTPAPAPNPPPAPAPTPTPPPPPNGCSFSLSPERRMVTAAGGDTSVRVKTDAGCEWTATTSQSWIKVSTTRGVGDGDVVYTVDRNPGAAREGTVTVSGQVHRVEQHGANSVAAAVQRDAQLAATNRAKAGVGSIDQGPVWAVHRLGWEAPPRKAAMVGKRWR